MTFAEKLKELRQAAGMSQAKLAESAGTSLRTITQYEQALRMPTFDMARKLAKALDIELSALAEYEMKDDVQSAPKPARSKASPKTKRK